MVSENERQQIIIEWLEKKAHECWSAAYDAEARGFNARSDRYESEAIYFETLLEIERGYIDPNPRDDYEIDRANERWLRWQEAVIGEQEGGAS